MTTTIDDMEVLTSQSALLPKGAKRASFDTELGRFRVVFTDGTSSPPSVTTTVGDEGVTLTVTDSTTNLPYAYDGMLNVDGVPAFSVGLYVSPLGEEVRARFLMLSIARLPQ